jgi:hypothetical protein
MTEGTTDDKFKLTKAEAKKLNDIITRSLALEQTIAQALVALGKQRADVLADEKTWWEKTLKARGIEHDGKLQFVAHPLGNNPHIRPKDTP